MVTSVWPRCSLYDAGEKLVLVAELAGIEAHNISVAVIRVHNSPDRVLLRGFRQHEATDGFEAHRRERRFGAFSREVPLPVPVWADTVLARLRRGLLWVEMKKATEPRMVAVEAS